MSDLKRFGASLNKELLERFDKLIKERQYSSRSEAIADIIRENLVREAWNLGKEVSGAVVLVYDHHKRELVNRLMNVQHDFHDIIISTQHIHLDHDNCLEIIAVKGKANEITKLSDKLHSSKGVKHGALAITTAGKEVK